MIAIADYGIGNLGSVTKAFRHVGAEVRLTGDVDELPVPHMGWNVLRPRRAHPMLDGLPEGAYVYFVHSYYCDAPEDVVIASSDYGRDFAAVVGRGSVVGVQFHPEKSQEVGLRMVEGFVRIVDAARRAA